MVRPRHTSVRLRLVFTRLRLFPIRLWLRPSPKKDGKGSDPAPFVNHAL